MIKLFFQGNATVALVVLVLITLFLFREGVGFFPQNAANLRIYRHAGLEYVDYVRRQSEEHARLAREIQALRLKEFLAQTNKGMSIEGANAALSGFDAFAESFDENATALRGILSQMTEIASAIKEKNQIYHDRLEQRKMLRAAGKPDAATKVVLAPVNFADETKALTNYFGAYRAVNAEYAAGLEKALTMAPALPSPQSRNEVAELHRQVRAFIATFPDIERAMTEWRWDMPVPWYRAVTAFLLGREWLTASFWQDFYGIVPLLAGSLLVSAIALLLAVPMGISAAIYVSEIASPRERNLIKPYIELLSAIPSVVLGFFGVVVFGEAMRATSQLAWLGWVPGFPMSERLNAFTAGCLLALMAIPTVFSLAEDALTSVPRELKEASYALGADQLQTITRVVVPASFTGIISAVLLGFGRVIGETMVVLLCAGNRIAIPDFTHGLATFFQPVHTMTGIIAQEMGEVVRGSIQYRALFMVGVVLFILSLGINYLAQGIVRKYRLGAG